MAERLPAGPDIPSLATVREQIAEVLERAQRARARSRELIDKSRKSGIGRDGLKLSASPPVESMRGGRECLAFVRDVHRRHQDRRRLVGEILHAQLRRMFVPIA